MEEHNISDWLFDFGYEGNNSSNKLKKTSPFHQSQSRTHPLSLEKQAQVTSKSWKISSIIVEDNHNYVLKNIKDTDALICNLILQEYNTEESLKDLKSTYFCEQQRKDTLLVDYLTALEKEFQNIERQTKISLNWDIEQASISYQQQIELIHNTINESRSIQSQINDKLLRVSEQQNVSKYERELKNNLEHKEPNQLALSNVHKRQDNNKEKLYKVDDNKKVLFGMYNPFLQFNNSCSYPSQKQTEKSNSQNRLRLQFQLGNQYIQINLSQVQRQNLLNLIRNKKIKEYVNCLIKLLDKQSSISLQTNKEVIFYQAKQQILEQTKDSNISLQKQTRQLKYKQQELPQKNLLNLSVTDLMAKGYYKLNCYFNENNQIKDSERQKNIQFDNYQLQQQSLSKQSSIKDQKQQSEYQLINETINTIPVKNLVTKKLIFSKQRNRILGGGNGCSSCSKKNNNAKISDEQKIQNQVITEKEENILKGHEYFQKKPQKNQKININLVVTDGQKVDYKLIYGDCFETDYQTYYSDQIVLNNLESQTKIEGQIRKICQTAFQGNIEEMLDSNNRVKVIDLINLTINYLLLTISRKSEESMSDKIQLVNQILEEIKKNCIAKKKQKPCLDIHLYMGILISLNSLRVGKDTENEGLAVKIGKLLLQVVETGSQLMSIAGAVKSLTQIDVDSIKKFISDVKTIFQKIAGTVKQIAIDSNEIVKYYKSGTLYEQLYALWIRKTDYLQNTKNKLEESAKEFIFYLKELRDRNITEVTMIKFILMQINYLLQKEIENQKFMEFSESLKKEKDLVMDFVNSQLLKKYKKTLLDYIKSVANLIANSEEFRYLQASILLKLVVMIKHLKDEKNFKLIMISLCRSFLQEVYVSVKIVYKDNDMMIDFIHNTKNLNLEIIKEQKVIQSEMVNKLDVQQQQINKSQKNFQEEGQIDEEIANTFIEMWEISVRQRQELNQIAHKDDALLEAVHLYIKQSITFLNGQNVFAIQDNTKSQITQNKKEVCTYDNALQQIIDNFLIPNYQDPKSKDIQQNQQNGEKNPCKILSILADGGTGKSMLIKKLEVELLKAQSQFIKENEERAQFIPLTIKCNSLSIEKPSIEDFLESQNLDKKNIQNLKSSQKNKLILLDGYDEYTGEYFNVYQTLKLYDWVNTIVIVTSRLEKISISDAKTYFSTYDKFENQGEDYAIVKLERFSNKDIEEYLNRFKEQISETNKTFKKEVYQKVQNQIIMNESLIELLQLPINLYLTTRMMVDMNLEDKSILNSFLNATEQVEIQELFFEEQFSKKSNEFIDKFEIKDETKVIELKKVITSCYFDYFQTISMKMFVSKGIKPNYLSTNKEQPSKIKLRKRYEDRLSLDQVMYLKNSMSKYVDSRVITRVKVSYGKQKDENNNNHNQTTKSNQQAQKKGDEDEEFEFRHKSIFEYFAARAMRFDFEFHDEIHNLKIEELQEFNINKKSIMVSEKNQSEQQILIKLQQLIKLNCKNIDYIQNFNNLEDNSKNNKYIQYIRQSKITLYNKTSIIDTGASNLLSALFLSDLAFDGFRLNNCSISKLYNATEKSNDIVFDQCNLSHAFLKNIELDRFQSSYTENSIFDTCQQVYGSDNIYHFQQIIFRNEILISISKKGYINKFIQEQGEQEFKLVKSQKITSSSLYDIKSFQNSQIVVSANNTLFFLNEDFEVLKIQTFTNDIENFDCSDNNLIVKLQNKEILKGNCESGFMKIIIDEIILEKSSSNGDYFCTLNEDEIIIYKIALDKLLQISKIKDENSKGIKSIRISETGRYIAANSQDSNVSIWKLAKNGYIFLSNIGNANLTAFSFSKGNSYLHIFMNKDWKIYDIEQNKCIFTIVIEQIPKIWAISYDRTIVAYSYNYRHCKFYNLEKEISIINIMDQNIGQVEFSQDGKYLATGSYSDGSTIWDAKQRYKLIKKLSTQRQNCFTFSQDSQYFARCRGKTFEIFEVNKMFQLFKTFQIDDSVEEAAFTPNGVYFVTRGAKMINFYNVENNYAFAKKINTNQKAMAFSPNSKTLAVFSQRQICLWDIEKDFKNIKELNQKYTINSIDFSQDGKYLAFYLDNEIQILDAKKEYIHIQSIVCGFHLQNLKFSFDSKYLIIAQGSRNCNLYSVVDNFQLIHEVKINSEVNNFAFSSDSKSFVTSSEDQSIRIWNIEKSFELIHKKYNNIKKVIISENGKYFATLCIQTWKIWKLEYGCKLLKTIKNESKYFNKIGVLNFSPNEKYLVVIFCELECTIWNCDNWEIVKQIKLDYSDLITEAVFSSDSKYLILCEKNFSVYEAEKKFVRIKSEIPHNQNRMLLMVISSNGKQIATQSKDSNQQHYISIWNSEDLSLIKKEQIEAFYKMKYFLEDRYLVIGQKKKYEIRDVNQLQVVHTIKSDSSEVALTTYGHYLFIGEGSMFKIYDEKKEFKLVNTVKYHQNRFITCMDYSIKGKYLVICCEQYFSIWNTQKGIETQNSFEVIFTV